MALERLKVKAGGQFDPNNAAHMEALVKKVSETRGTGWSVQSWDPDTGQVTLVRGAALTELRGSKGGASFEVSLGSAIKPNEGELTAQRLEEEHDGFYLTEFRPHVKRARMTKMSEAELRCRDALANVIGVPRWEVQVSNRRGGGFTFLLPPKYSPSKHDDKILEVAESVVGRPGWYVKTDARALRGEIIPAEQPTFEPAYPFDFSSLPPADAVDDKELWRIPLGVALGGNGVPNHPISIDFSDSVGCLLVGLAGAGKSVTTQSVVFSALAKGWQLALINTVDKATDFAWAKSFVRDNFWGCDSVAQSVAVAKLIGEEGERRGALLSEYGASKWQDLPARVKRENPPLMVVADELAALLTADPLPGGLSKEMKELPEFVAMAQSLLESKLLVTALGKLPAVYRAAGIRVIYLTQQPNERYGFSTKLKGNLPHRVMLGVSPSQAEKGHAFRTPEKIPDVPMNISQDSARARGVGLAHLDGQEPAVFKGYFAPLDTYIAEAKRRGFPTAIHPAPSAGQISRLVPRIDGDDDGIADSGGPLGGGGGGFGHGPRQYEPWELGPDGQPLTGFERANAARHQATVGANMSG